MNLETKRLKEKIMMAISKKFTHSMNISLIASITEGEFQLQPRLWPKERPQALMINFFVRFWHINVADFHGMIVRSIEAKRSLK
jgi:hypothetical protein